MAAGSLRSRPILTATMVTLLAAAWLSGALSSPAGAAGTSSTPSIVQLGDSIASGEGTLYQAPDPQHPDGQLYFCQSSTTPSSSCYSYFSGSYKGYWVNWPSTEPGTWTPATSQTYPECHQSTDAYGQVVAGELKAKFTQLACTGASYAAGVTGPETFAQGDVYSSAFLDPYTSGAPSVKAGKSVDVPAEFGTTGKNGTPSGVNAAYTSAHPNVVLVTLGADDLKFVDILTACIEWNYAGSHLSSSDRHDPPTRYGTGYRGPLQCSDDNATDQKGPTGSAYKDGVIQDYYTNQLDTLHDNITSLLTAVEKEGQQPGQSGPPKIVITNYPNPLPNSLPQKKGSDWADDYCPDTFPLYNAQVDYFSGLVDQLDHQLSTWVTSYQASSEFGKNVSFVNLSNVDDEYQWCDDQSGNPSPTTGKSDYREPYAYGFSVNATLASLSSYPSPAIFHPTITGQEQIAACVKPAVSALLDSDAASTSTRDRDLRLLADGRYRVSSTADGHGVLDSC